MCRGAKTVFLQVVGGVKKGFSKRNVLFGVCLCYVGERKRERMKTMENDNFKKNTETGVFGWL